MIAVWLMSGVVAVVVAAGWGVTRVACLVEESDIDRYGTDEA